MGREKLKEVLRNDLNFVALTHDSIAGDVVPQFPHSSSWCPHHVPFPLLGALSQISSEIVRLLTIDEHLCIFGYCNSPLALLFQLIVFSVLYTINNYNRRDCWKQKIDPGPCGSTALSKGHKRAVLRCRVINLVVEKNFSLVGLPQK